MLLSHFVDNPLDVIGRCHSQWLCMADVLVIVADVKATLFLFVENHNLMNCLVVADVMATLLIG